VGWKWDGNGWNFDEIRIIRKIRWVGCWALEKENHSPEVVFKKNDFEISTLCNSSRVMFF
jgi:hypothetical protein